MTLCQGKEYICIHHGLANKAFAVPPMLKVSGLMDSSRTVPFALVTMMRVLRFDDQTDITEI